MNVNRRGFLRVVGGLAAALSVDRSPLASILASRAAPPKGLQLRPRKLIAHVFVTQELLDDSAFDVAAMLTRVFGENFKMKVI